MQGRFPQQPELDLTIGAEDAAYGPLILTPFSPLHLHNFIFLFAISVILRNHASPFDFPPRNASFLFFEFYIGVVQLDQLVSRSVSPRPRNLFFANYLCTRGHLLITFPILFSLPMFVLLVSDHVGLVLCLEQAPGLGTNKYVARAFGVHVEVEYLLGLLSVSDLNSLHP